MIIGVILKLALCIGVVSSFFTIVTCAMCDGPYYRFSKDFVSWYSMFVCMIIGYLVVCGLFGFAEWVISL